MTTTGYRETVVIGDIHGCYDELQELMYAIHFDSKRMRLVFLGDIGDRGPNSAECVWYIKGLCENGAAECVNGNHDARHVRYRGHELKKALSGKENPMKPLSINDSAFHNRLTDADIAWMRKLPLKIHLRDTWWAIHGGLEPAFNFNDQSPEQIIRCRYVSDGTHTSSSGKVISLGRAIPLGKNMSQPANSFYWADGWSGPESIVYGHCVHSLVTPLISSRLKEVKCVGIDTGCVFGGHLTAFFLDRNEFVKVKARREYCPLKAQGEE